MTENVPSELVVILGSLLPSGMSLNRTFCLSGVKFEKKAMLAWYDNRLAVS